MIKINKIEKICCYFLTTEECGNISNFKKDVDSGEWFIKLSNQWEVFNDATIIKFLEKEIIKDLIR